MVTIDTIIFEIVEGGGGAFKAPPLSGSLPFTNIPDQIWLNMHNIMMFNYKETTEEFIEDISITKKINYLGITIQDKKDCYKLQKLENLEKAKKNANIMPAVIAKSCNKLIIGKTYWKSVALPS